MTRKAGVVVTILITGLLLTVAASAGASLLPISTNRVMPNVHAGNRDLGGMSREQGVLKLLEFEDQLKEKNVTLTVQNTSRKLPLKSVDVDINEQTVMDRALQVGHTGPIWQRWNERVRVRNETIRIPLAVNLDRKKLKGKVNNLLADITSTPVDASFRITPDDNIEIIPGQKAYQVEHEALYDKLLMLVAHGVEPYEAEVALVDIEPTHTVESIKSMGIKGLLSSYSTKFNPDLVGRTYNVRVAAAALDGRMISPGEEVSFNKVVGPRSTEAGYKNAKIILNNEFVDGLGGGVCQVSSTLYNAVLLANLEVTDRDNHSLPVGYVPIGRDATVAYNYLDFRFKNNQDSYILIKSKVGNNSLTFKIYGNTDNKKDVAIKSWVVRVLEPEVIYEKDSNLAKGEQIIKQEGIRGYKAAGELIISQNGEETHKPLPESLYRARNEIIAVGTKEIDTTIKIPVEPSPEEEQGQEQASDNTGGPSAEEGPAEDSTDQSHDDNNATEDVAGESSPVEEGQGEEQAQDNAEEPPAEEVSTGSGTGQESTGENVTEAGEQDAPEDHSNMEQPL